MRSVRSVQAGGEWGAWLGASGVCRVCAAYKQVGSGEHGQSVGGVCRVCAAYKQVVGAGSMARAWVALDCCSNACSSAQLAAPPV